MPTLRRQRRQRRQRRPTDPKTERLRSCEIFASFPDRELAEIANTIDESHVSAGDVLTRQGQAAHDAFLILDGECRVMVDDVEIATLGPADMVGEMALLDRSDRSATVVANTDVDLLVLDRRTFWPFVERQGIRKHVMRQLTERLRRAGAARVAE